MKQVLLTLLFSVSLIFGQVTYHTIYEIQKTATGQAGPSPLAGSTVMTSGVVTAVGDNGFALQDSAAAWNGIWVFTTNAPTVARGDSVTVTGLVDEYYDFTELQADNANVTVLASNVALPAPLIVATGDFPQEAYEGVLVRLTDATCTNPDLGYGEWEVDDGSGPCRVDDHFYPFTATQGEVYDVTGIGWYSFSNYKLEPRDADDVQVATAIAGPRRLESPVPGMFRLQPAYPNPFNPATTLRFSVPAGMSDRAVSLTIYDITGRQIAVLYRGKIKPGMYQMRWQAPTQTASGIYFAVLQAGHSRQIQRLIYMK